LYGAAVLLLCALAGCRGSTDASGESWQDSAAKVSRPLDAYEQSLQRVVEVLAGRIGARNVRHPAALEEAARFIEGELRAAGLTVERQTFVTEGVQTSNVVATVPGGATADEIVVVGAHYDTAASTPGADANASGVAAVLALARAAAHAKPERTLRFAFFTNEEPPYYQTDNMGSLVYARACKERDEVITAALSIDSVGIYSDAPSDASYPWPFRMYYPGAGRYLSFVGNPISRELVDRAAAAFRRKAALGSEVSVISDWVDGVPWSDHWAFWRTGYPAIMVTDAAAFRSPNYHLATDTPEKLDYTRLARAVLGLEDVVADLAGAQMNTGDPDTARRRAKLKELHPAP